MNDEVSHPNFGKEVRIEQHGHEVHLVFVANSKPQSDSLCQNLLSQLKAGSLYLRLTGGPPTSIEETKGSTIRFR